MPENDYDQNYYEGELNPSYVTASPVTKKGQRKLRRARGRAQTAQAIQTYMTDSKLPKSVLSERARNGDSNAYLSLTAQGRDEDTNRVLRFGAANLGAGLLTAAGAAAVPVVEGISAGTSVIPGLVSNAGRMLGNGLVKAGEYVSPVFNNPVMKFVFSRPVQGAISAGEAARMGYNWAQTGERPSTSDIIKWGVGTGLGVGLGGGLNEASKAAYEIPGYVKGLAQTGVDLGKEVGNGIVQTKIGSRIYDTIRDIPAFKQTLSGPTYWTGVPYEYIHNAQGKLIGLNPNHNYNVYAASSSPRMIRFAPEYAGVDTGKEVAQQYSTGLGFSPEMKAARNRLGVGDYCKVFENGKVYRVYDMTPQDQILKLPEPVKAEAYLWNNLPVNYKALESNTLENLMIPGEHRVVRPQEMGLLREGMPKRLGTVEGPLWSNEYLYHPISTNDLIGYTSKGLTNAAGKPYLGVEIPSIWDGPRTPFDERILLNTDNVIFGKPGESPWKAYFRNKLFPNTYIRKQGGKLIKRK